MVLEGIQLYNWFQWWVMAVIFVFCLHMDMAMQWIAECDMFFMCDGI